MTELFACVYLAVVSGCRGSCFGGSSRDLNVTFEKNADSLLDDGVNACLGVLVDLVQTDIVLTVSRVAKLRHCDWIW